jgi:hypothetical protein
MLFITLDDRLIDPSTKPKIQPTTELAHLRPARATLDPARD